jgi:hypothetical protein
MDLGRLAFTNRMAARAVDVGRFFHGFAGGAAIFAGRDKTRTHWVLTFC